MILLSQFQPQPREHIRTPSDCVEMMKQAAALMDEDPENITLDDETMVMSTSSHEEGAYELFGDFVYDWAIRDGKRFI